MSEKLRKRVLMICTGGTIGMLHKIEGDTSSPLIPAGWEQIKKHSPAFDALPFDVVTDEMELIDSSDMHPGYWMEIAKKIDSRYREFDGFVVLHGTDTMSYTATALSFIFENLGKPVIVTGSQLPLAKARSDASQNMVTSLMIAAAADGLAVIPEVCIFFNNVLLRGNRTRKVSSTGLDGFDSPNYTPLATVGEHIEINSRVLRKIPNEGFFINAHLETNVMMFDIFPGISRQIIKNIFQIKGLKGVIFRTYGSGNAPTDDNLLGEIEQAIHKGIAVVNITQCNQGIVEMGLYNASVKLSRMGVISGVDMTPEAALVKMMYLIGQGYETEDLKEQMQKDLRGEQRYNVFNLNYNYDSTEDSFLRLKSQRIPAGFDKEKIARANLRFDGIKIKAGEEITLAIYMNYPSASKDTDINIPQCIGFIENVNENTDCIIDCTEKVKQVINPSQPVQLSVVARNGDVAWGGAILSIFTDVD